MNRSLGAVFRVSRRSTAEYVDVTTGPDGTYLLENLEEDWYEVYELRSPTGMSPTTPITTSSSSPAKPPNWW